MTPEKEIYISHTPHTPRARGIYSRGPGATGFRAGLLRRIPGMNEEQAEDTKEDRRRRVEKALADHFTRQIRTHRARPPPGGG